MPPFRHRKGVGTVTSGPSHAAGSSIPPTRQYIRSSSAAGPSILRKSVPARSAKVASHRGSSKDDLVGPVTETTRDHMKRHWPFNEHCPRCHWIKKGDEWRQRHGRVPEGHRTPLTGEFWCMPRQPRRGGQWALGCTVCGLVNESCIRGEKTTGKSAKLKRRRQDFDTKWARQEVRSIQQASLIAQHARGDQHMRALRFLNRPASNEAAAEETPSDCEGSGVFRGKVPQPWDWLSALSACRRLKSWTTATLDANDRRPASSRLLNPWTLKKMCETKREAIRTRKRKWLSDATYVSLASDDRQRYKLLKFKCDLGPAPPRASTELGARHGLIGVDDQFAGMTEDDFDDDYGLRVVEGWRRMLIRFFTPLGNAAHDAEAYDSFRLKVVVFATDKALLKAVYLAKDELFPNLILSLPDASHTVRIACRDPLHRVEPLTKIFDTLFLRERALLKDLRFSDLWAAKLVVAQKRILEDREVLGADVGETIRTFSFAPQRFESFYTPLVDFLVVLPAIVAMLKMIAEDWRDSKAQQRAIHAMDAMTGQFVLDTGLVADYAALSVRLIRAFDTHDKDPAITFRILSEWKAHLRNLFLGGAIARIPSHAAGGDGAASPAKTATQIALEQIDYIGEVDYEGHIQDFMATPPKQMMQESLRAMTPVVEAAIGRVNVEFCDEDLYMCMEIFDMVVWEPLLALAPSQSLLTLHDDSTPLRLARKLRSWLDANADEYKTLDEWAVAVSVAYGHLRRLRLASPQIHPLRTMDNRIGWALAIADFDERLPWAARPVRFYLACLEGSGDVERAFSTHTALLKAHSGKRCVTDDPLHVDAIEVATEILIDGPADEADLFVKTAEGHYQPTPLALECAELWIRLRGRRFGCYKKRKDAGTSRQPRRGTRAAVRSSQTEALDRLADPAKPSRRLAGISTDELRSMRLKVRAKPLKPTKTMTDFTATTEARAAEKKEVRSWRGFGNRPELRQKKRSSGVLAPPQEPPVRSDPVLLMAVHCGGTSGIDPYKRLTGSALSAAAGFSVDSIRAVYGGSASTSKLLVWLEVFARGLVVQELAGTKRRFSPAYLRVKAAVHFSTQFEQKQPTLVERFRHFANMPKSQWKRAAEADRKKAHDIQTLEDFRKFLLGIQRVPSNSMAFSQRCRPPRPE